MDKKVLFRHLYRWAVFNSKGRVRYIKPLYQSFYKFYLVAGYDVFKDFIENYCGATFKLNKRSTLYKSYYPRSKKGGGYAALIEDMKFINS